MEEKIYCLKCKKRTSNGEVSISTTSKNRNIQKTKCVICNTKKNRFIKKTININGD